MTFYKLNPMRARELESESNVNNGKPRITEKGAYTGTLTNVREFTSKNGNIGIIIDYKDDSGAMVRSNRFMTHDASRKKQMWGLPFIDSLMTCMKVREMSGVPGTYERWDNNARKMVEEDATIFPDLMNKPIGVILQPEEYELDGEVRQTMRIRGFFEPFSRLTATEILDKKVNPERVDKWVASMADVSRQGKKKEQKQQQVESAPEVANEDIPF